MTELQPLLPRVEDLATLPYSQLLKIKDLLEKYFSTTGTNVVLHNIVKSIVGQNFKKNVKKAIMNQVLNIALVDKIAQYMGTLKAEHDISLFDEWEDFEDEYEGGKKRISLFLLFAGELAGLAALRSLRSSDKFKLTNKSILKELDDRVGILSEVLDSTTKDWIIRTIDAGRERGANPVLITTQIRERIERVAEARASMILETEAVNAMGLVETEVYKRSGIEYIEWRVTPSERNCNICLGNEFAGKVRVGEEFPSGDTHPPVHQYCACLLSPVLPDEYNINVWTGK
jgi:SPP1 gp7 family putative phage head morphogenesis protein